MDFPNGSGHEGLKLQKRILTQVYSGSLSTFTPQSASGRFNLGIMCRHKNATAGSDSTRPTIMMEGRALTSGDAVVALCILASGKEHEKQLIYEHYNRCGESQKAPLGYFMRMRCRSFSNA